MPVTRERGQLIAERLARPRRHHCERAQPRHHAIDDLRLPGGRTLPVHLRTRAGALLLAAARLSGVPLAEYKKADVKREFLTEKGCAPNCTISCVHQVSYIDHWRAPQVFSNHPPSAQHGGHPELVQIQ